MQLRENNSFHSQELIGKVVHDRYQILSLLGSGSFGRVYVAQDLTIEGFQVALKLIPRKYVLDRVPQERFVREIMALAHMDHDHIAKMYEPLMSENFVGYTMELAPNGDLAHKIAPGQLWRVPFTIRILLQIASALEYIHSASFIHRDLKPANILLFKEDLIKISDLGLIREAQTDEIGEPLCSIESRLSKITEPGNCPGTPDYMAPETITHGVTNACSDIYALGTVAYELLTGSCPFEDENMFRSLERKISSEPEGIRCLNPNCSLNLEQIVLNALKREPNLRYQSALHLKRDLFEEFLRIEQNSGRQELLPQPASVVTRNPIRGNQPPLPPIMNDPLINSPSVPHDPLHTRKPSQFFLTNQLIDMVYDLAFPIVWLVVLSAIIGGGMSLLQKISSSETNISEIYNKARQTQPIYRRFFTPSKSSAEIISRSGSENE